MGRVLGRAGGLVVHVIALPVAVVTALALSLPVGAMLDRWQEVETESAGGGLVAMLALVGPCWMATAFMTRRMLIRIALCPTESETPGGDE